MPPDAFGPLIQTGAMGVMLVWLMLRFEKTEVRQEKQSAMLAAAMDRQTRAVLLLITSDETRPRAVKEHAKKILHETEEAEVRLRPNGAGT